MLQTIQILHDDGNTSQIIPIFCVIIILITPKVMHSHHPLLSVYAPKTNL